MSFKKHYFKEGFSTWEYSPDDPYTAIYDFYALSLIYPEKINNDNLKYAFKEAKDTSIKYMTEFLLEQLERAVAAEVSHYTQFRKLDALNDYVPKYLKRPASRQFFKDYVKEFATKSLGDRLLIKTDSLGSDSSYDAVYKLTQEFLKKYHYSIFDLFNFGKEAFNDMTGWRSDQFGGSAWAKIAQSGLDVLESKNNRNANERMAILDHVFDLEHNTGSIFTKNKSLDSHRIKDILDDKRDITNEATYYFRVGPSLKAAWAAVIKDVLGKTIEEEEPKINKQDTFATIKRHPFEIKYIQNPPVELQQIAIDTDPYSIVYINNPDIDILRQALEHDIDIFKHLKPEVKNRIPKDVIEELFGSEWSEKENRSKEELSTFKEI